MVGVELDIDEVTFKRESSRTSFRVPEDKKEDMLILAVQKYFI